MIQKFWRCKPLEAGNVRTRIENVCRQAGMEYANILYWPIFGGRMITAGVMGLVKKFRYILVTGAFIRFLEPDEIDAVIAHEVGHIKKNHLLFYLVFFVGYMLVSYATFDLLIYGVLYAEPLYGFIGRIGLNQTTLTSSIFSIASVMLLDCVAIPITMLLSYYIFRQQYSSKHYLGTSLCLFGVICVMLSDVVTGRDTMENVVQNDPIRGDFFTLVGSSLYAISNIGQEYFMRIHTPQSQ